MKELIFVTITMILGAITGYIIADQTAIPMKHKVEYKIR